MLAFSCRVRRCAPCLLPLVLVACSSAAEPAVDPDAAPGVDAAAAIDGAPAPDATAPSPDAAIAPDAAAGTTLAIFADDYGAGVSYAPFGGSTGGPVLVTDAHTGTTALRIDVPAAGYTGGAMRLDAPVDLSGFTAVTFWARASQPASLNVVGIGNDAATNVYQAEDNALPLTTSWQRFVVPIPAPDRLIAERGLFHVAEGPEEGVYAIFLDDIQYETLGDDVIGPAHPAIATESVTRAVGATFPVNGCSVTYQVQGVQRTIASARPYFTFTSSDPAVATVDAAGVVTAVAPGTATITARLGAIDAVGALTFEVTAP